MSVMASWSAASLGYGGSTVVAPFDLELRAGELLGVIGPNGAGKSTLVKSLTGEARLVSGHVSIEGRPVSDYASDARARIVAVVPQKVDAAFMYSGEEFVDMGRHAHRSRFAGPGSRDAQVVVESMARTDTSHLAHRAVNELSGGELQRLAFAQALAQEPKILLLDEPTNHLDLNHRLQVLDLARDLAADGVAVLAVFHDLELAARYSDRMLVVSDGRVGFAASPDEVLTPEVVRSVFGVRAVVGPDPVTGAVSVTPLLRDAAVAGSSPGSVLVIGGSGVAAPLMRRLTLQGWEVFGGALNEGDSDATVCAALGLRYVALPPFAPMSPADREAVEKLARRVDLIVVCDVPFGHGNIDNLAALGAYAEKTVLIGSIEGRDYCNGDATMLWNALCEDGARIVSAPDLVTSSLLG